MNGQTGGGINVAKKVFGIRETKTEANELLQTGTDRHQRIRQNAEKNSNSRGRKCPSQRDTELEN